MKLKQYSKKLPTNKIHGPEFFTGEFYQSFEEVLTPILLKLLQKIQEEGKLTCLYYEVSIIQIPKPDRDTTKKENYRSIFLIYINVKILKKNISN